MSAAIVVAIRPRPAAWEVLAEGLVTRRPVRAGYHGSSRLLCPHVLGWRNGRAKALSYQLDAASGGAPVPPDQRWRLMFIDEIEDATLVDGDWQTATNYARDCTGIDVIELAVEATGGQLK